MEARSESQGVQNFLEKAQVVDPPKYEIIAKLREMVFAEYPNIHERMMYGGILFALSKM